jgi:catechol 2,3-dioxygenase-like lactoylglutathione lyase family enzyme
MFKRIDYLTIRTDDVADAARVWEATLGLKGRAPQAMVGVRSISVPVGDAFLELAQPEGEGPYGDWLRQQAEGMCLVGIEVEDLAAAVSHLRARGAKVSDPQEGGAPGVSFALVDTAFTHGVPIALVQRST